MKIVKNFLPLLLVSSLCACMSTATVKNVEKVSFSTASGSIAPQYQFKESLVVNGDLTTHWRYAKTQSPIPDRQQKIGKITPAQMQQLKQKIQQSNYMNVNVRKNHEQRIGGSTRTLIITTNLGTRQFYNDGFMDFPEVIANIFSEYNSLKPQ